jgi:DNA helicase-2/ATP-dependent DNA helicase PcrA
LAIVNGTAPFASQPERRQTIDEHEVRRVLDTLVTFPRRANTDPAAAWIEALSAVRLGLRSPAAVEDDFDGDVDGLRTVFDGYRRALEQRGAVDFDEQIYRAVEILLTDARARAAAQRACRMLLVDEFQDLTPAHVLLVRLLAGPAANVFGVGDDDQTIYGYAGASPQWLLRFAELFPGAGAHGLTVNYRCPPAVVRAAACLLRRNRVRVPKEINPPEGKEATAGGLVVLRADDANTTTALAATRVEDLVTGGTAPADVAVLARVNAVLVSIQLALRVAGVPVERALDERWLDRPGVRAALAWLRLAAAPTQLRAADVSMAARRPPRALSPKVVEWMAEQRSVSRLRALADRVSGRDADKISLFADDLDELAVMVRAGHPAAEVLAAIRDDVGLDQAMLSLEQSRRRLDRSAQTDDLDALVALAGLHPDVATLEAWIRDELRQPGQKGGVTLATIHSVKGREWPHVLVFEASAGLVPHRLAEDYEEERRVFHVGVTRGIESVTVIAGMVPSPFVAELTRPVDEDRAAPAGGPVAVRAERARATGPSARRPAAGGARAAAGPSAGAPDAAGGASAAALSAALSAALKEWRRGYAQQRGQPAFTVLHDSTLDEIARAAPKTLRRLAQIRGIGPAKLEQFGDAILAVVDATAGTGSVVPPAAG